MAQQSDTVGLPKRLPLVIEPENRDTSTLKDAKLINGYVEKGKKDGEYHIYKRPGLLNESTIAGAGLGVYNWRGKVYRIQGATIYEDGVAIGGGAPNGALDTTGGIYHFESCLGTTPSLQFGNGVATYNYDLTTPITALAGANYPSPAAKGIVYLDGTTYIMDQAAAIRGCATLNAPTDWTDVLNTITAQIEPDGGIGLFKQLVYVIAFKQWSTEVFYDAQNALASPLGPVQGAKVNYGCLNADSVQEIDGTIFWLGVNRNTNPQILQLDNLKPLVVSTKPIDRLLAQGATGTVYSFAFKLDGHKFYVITLKSTNITLVYNVSEQMWSQWTDADGNYFPIVAATFNANYDLLLQHESNGKLYSVNSSYGTDDGAQITFDLYTPNFDGGIRREKVAGMLYVIADQQAGSTMQVRSNDKDYAAAAWSNFRTVDLGMDTPFLPDNGSFRRRAYHLRHTAPTALRLQALEMQLDLGTM